MKRIAMGMVITAMAMLFAGCAVHHAVTGPSKIDMDFLKVGAHRDQIRTELGFPKFSGKDNDGNEYEAYGFVQGSGGGWRTTKVFFYAITDLVTVGIAEVLWTPLEYAARGTKMAFRITYGPDQKVIKIEDLKKL